MLAAACGCRCCCCCCCFAFSTYGMQHAAVFRYCFSRSLSSLSWHALFVAKWLQTSSNSRRCRRCRRCCRAGAFQIRLRMFVHMCLCAALCECLRARLCVCVCESAFAYAKYLVLQRRRQQKRRVAQHQPKNRRQSHMLHLPLIYWLLCTLFLPLSHSLSLSCSLHSLALCAS